MLAFSRLAQGFGRKKAFAIGFVGRICRHRFLLPVLQRSQRYMMSAVMGFAQLSLFAGFAIYLPELSPYSFAAVRGRVSATTSGDL